jgi:hypothetical protein
MTTGSQEFSEGNYLSGGTKMLGGLAGMAIPFSGKIRSAGKVVGKNIDDISVFPKPQKMFPEDARPAGGEYLNPATQDILTGMFSKKGRIVIPKEGPPSFKISPEKSDIIGSPDIKGATQIKTNLFKKKAGWKWDKAPKGYEDAPTLVSVENKGKHYYTLDAQFPEGVNLSRYAKSKTEPRLRPTIKGFVELGKPIGKISVRGKEHPVYDKIINREEGGQIMPMQYGGGLDAAYLNMSRRRSNAFN